MVNTILKEADLFCPNSVRINFTIYLSTRFWLVSKLSALIRCCVY
ncbi:ABC transporter ATP-binding protein [Lactiplantibacillus plantarum]|nr:ABC transporter ATP-binding protein [Lactiplantibacillus plantarum]RZN68286.1 ABC transporter ATP-binding protein [Lactiplantibacillus plantarum]